MKTITEHAYAKLNISLDVLSKLPNGYHEMKMIMQSVTLCDDLTISLCTGSGAIHVTTNKSFLPADGGNIAGKAAKVFMDKICVGNMDVNIHIHKRIPVCAGLGGGSADAAAVLRGLNRLMGIGFRREHLEMLGEEVGSDVPYCVAGGTALAEGRGEVLSDLWAMPETYVLICKPQFSVSTPVLFKKLDSIQLKHHPDTEGMMAALQRGDRRGIARRVFNVFEEVPEREFEEVRRIKDVLSRCGAQGAAMSGTGSAVFGLFETQADAEKAYACLHPRYEECFVCRTLNKLDLRKIG